MEKLKITINKDNIESIVASYQNFSKKELDKFIAEWLQYTNNNNKKIKYIL